MFLYFREPDIPRATLEKKYADSASRFLKLPGGARAHVRDEGLRDGPPLVLIHGSNASFVTWKPWVKRLGDTFRIISVDLPGHGLTGSVPNGDYSHDGMVKFLAEVADNLQLTKFALGGNSMGGRVSAGFVLEHSDRVTRLILVAATGLPYQDAPPTLVFRILRIPLLNRVLRHITPRSIPAAALNDGISRRAIIDDEMVDTYWDFIRMEGTRAATILRINMPVKTLEDRIHEIRIPTLILWGDEDRIVPVDLGHEFHRRIAGSRLILYPKTGHIPQEEVADESAAEVRAFLTAE
jgi:pimeloyl-ACP methyl ester carboxylesterase